MVFADEQDALQQDLEPLDADLAEGLDSGSDETEIEPHVATAKPVQSAGIRFHLRTWIAPASGLAWAMSLLFHGGVILGAVVAAKLYFQHAAAPAEFGGGGGCGPGVLIHGTDSLEPVEHGLAGVAVSVPNDPVEKVAASEDRVTSDPQSTGPQTSGSLVTDEPASDAVIFGVGGSLAMEAGLPRRASHASGPHAGDVMNRAQPGASSPQSGNSGQTTGVGLPGALLGRGLPTPDYPPEARRRGEQGVVKVSIEVLPDGQVGDIRVVSDPGFPALRESAVSSAQKLRAFRFVPARKFGKAVRDYVILPYQFVLR